MVEVRHDMMRLRRNMGYTMKEMGFIFDTSPQNYNYIESKGSLSASQAATLRIWIEEHPVNYEGRPIKIDDYITIRKKEEEVK